MNIHEQVIKAQKLIEEKEYKQAHQCLINLLHVNKYVADGYFLLAIIASEHGNYKKAIQLIEQAIVIEPNRAEYIAQLAKHYALTNDHLKAKESCKKAESLANLSALDLDTLGVAYSKSGLHHLATKSFKPSVAMAPDNAQFHFNLATSLKFTGDFEGAKAAFEKTIALAPDYYKAYSSLASLGGKEVASHIQEKMLGMAHEEMSADDRLYIGHALARIYEAREDYQQAYRYLSQAKTAKRKQLNYTIEDDERIFQRLMSVFNDKPKVTQASNDSREAIFVVGMPRTGTTLVERIISKHPDVTSAGELQNFGLLLKEFSATSSPYVIDAETIGAACNIDFEALGQKYIESTRVLTGATPRFVDKMPLNFLYTGFILSAFPQAKIVCLDRNPLDTVVSNFRQLFAVNFSYYNYSYDLATSARYYLLFKRLIAFWQEKYPDNFYLVNYEKLVNSPAEEAKKLIHFCGLTWQDCLVDIHKNTSPVATASAVQVRSPINNKAVGSWKKYDFCLDNVKSILFAAGMSTE
ncbi:hypothetical protein tloyanaT_23510 [Thalassotalea loyana]|jgi:tetratricopeptide (TPR) repeat protein|uniref:Sulfotransferase family protein n=1 Tax=Thalassotalea loyana TaxID=280483 RepID=A0ABQ6HDC6_9GAMM|nr:tetratricopeptide repeat-containing sulfotransferase family protein [Thalassotalea loyana]GLX86098.1 hypothetical protein tloyanaT_23510 [Thalassotalea loyana]